MKKWGVLTKSDNALECESEYIVTKSNFSLDSVLSRLEYLDYNLSSQDLEKLKKLSKRDLFTSFAQYDSWHHVSMSAKRIDYYDVNLDVLEEYLNGDFIIEKAKKQKVVQATKVVKIEKYIFQKKIYEKRSGKFYFNGYKENGYHIVYTLDNGKEVVYKQGRKTDTFDIIELKIDKRVNYIKRLKGEGLL